MNTENKFHRQLERSEQLNDLIIEIEDLLETTNDLQEKQDLLDQLKKQLKL